MKRILMSILAIFFPWVVLLIYDNPGGAVLALILQATVIGWIPSSIWALRTVRGAEKTEEKSPEKKSP